MFIPIQPTKMFIATPLSLLLHEKKSSNTLEKICLSVSSCRYASNEHPGIEQCRKDNKDCVEMVCALNVSFVAVDRMM